MDGVIVYRSPGRSFTPEMAGSACRDGAAPLVETTEQGAVVHHVPDPIGDFLEADREPVQGVADEHRLSPELENAAGLHAAHIIVGGIVRRRDAVRIAP